MASIYKRPSGYYTCEVYLTPLRKFKVGLHTKSAREARRMCDLIQALANSRRSGIENLDCVNWLRKLETTSPATLKRLIDLGLATPSQKPETHSISALIRHFIAHHDGVPKTIEKYNAAGENLTDFFGKTATLEEVTPERVLDFLAWLKTPDANRKTNTPYAEATISKRIANFKTLFTYAVKMGWCDKNHFLGITGGSQVNRARWHYVSRELAESVILSNGSLKWRTIFALGRFAGIRGASELNLTWDSVDFKNQVLKIHAEKLVGRRNEWRVVPMCQTLEKVLSEFKGESKSKKLFPEIVPHTNVNTMIRKLLASAKIKEWQEPWYNLRRSFCSDVMEAGVDAKVYESVTGHSWTVGMNAYQILHPEREKKGHEILRDFFGDNGGDTMPNNSD